MQLIRKFISALALIGLGLPAFGSQQVVNVGAAANDGTGDPARTAFQKINSNFTDLYTFLYAPLTGPVSTTSGSNATTISAGVLTNQMHALMPAQTVPCNFSVSSASPVDCTVAQMQSLLGISAGGAGSGTLNTINFSAPVGFSITPQVNGDAQTVAIAFAGGLPANEFLATPNGSSGTIGLRSLAAGDMPNFTGQVTSAAGVNTIAPNAVTNAMRALMAAGTIKCNPLTTTGPEADCTGAQAALLIGATGGGGATLTNQVDLCTYPGVDASGTADSAGAVNAAMQSVAGTNKILYVNCPVRIAIGLDPTKPIFVHNGTNLTFGPAGVFKVDNNTIGAFIFQNTVDSTWINARIQYVGSVTLNNAVAPAAGVAGLFSDTQMKAELVAQGYVFSGGGSNYWAGPTNASAIFIIRGAAKHLNFYNIKVFVAEGTPASGFIPVVVSCDTQWLLGSVTTNAPLPTASNSAGPTDINWINPIFDGFYMGFTGTGGSENIVNANFFRYSDLQDSSGGTQGGISNWLAPPHAIYLQNGDPSLNAHQHIANGYDWGVYVGGATRRSATGSGTLLSLKIEMTNGTAIDGWTSLRPDGCMDVLVNFAGGAKTGTIKNLTCVFNSAIATVDGTQIWGMRFPSNLPYQNMVFDNVTLFDTNPSPVAFPLVGNGFMTNDDISFTNLKVYQNDWSGFTAGFNFGGNQISVQGEYHYAVTSSDLQFKGSEVLTGTTICSNCNIDLKIFGWRQFPVAFSGALASGATTATLAASWGHSTGLYAVRFTSGDLRYVTLTSGSTAVGSFAALTAASAASGNIAGNALVNNFNAYKQRVLVNYAIGSVGTRVHILDVDNGYEATADNGVLMEGWSQMYSGSPSGTTSTGQATNITYPSTFGIDRNSVGVSSALGAGPTGFNIGWTGNNTALRSNVSIAANNPTTPLGAAVALPNNPTTVVLYPIGASFGAGGSLTVSTHASQMSAAQ
jgi:hypothetical protein